MNSAAAAQKSIQTEQTAVFMSDNTNVAGGYTKHPDYDSLPESIKAMYTPKEYAWLPQPLKNTILNDNTMPEVPEDD
jgi:hypothetical protein